MSEPVKLWRYYLSNENREGWAEIVIGSTGFFAAVSDYGNYAFAWRSMGVDDARKFFLRAPDDWCYFAGKLGGAHAREYDGVATRLAIREEIIRLRRDGGLTRDEARAEWELAEGNIEDSEVWLGIWWSRTKIDATELRRTRLDASLEAFCKVTMVRLAEVIRAELAKESEAA
jgi:hypothetical protein